MIQTLWFASKYLNKSLVLKTQMGDHCCFFLFIIPSNMCSLPRSDVCAFFENSTAHAYDITGVKPGSNKKKRNLLVYNMSYFIGPKIIMSEHPVLQQYWRLCQSGPWWRHQWVSKRRRKLSLTELNIVYHHSNQYNILCHKAELSEYLMLKFVSARYIFVHPKICPGTVWVQQVLPPFSASEENHKPFGSAQQNLEPAHFQSEVGFVRMFFQIHLSFGLYTSPVRLVAF